MAKKKSVKEPEPPPAITEVIISGFKSIAKEQKIEIRPLTILAGANSSGKSSMMQPLLMQKQTLEANYDPGPLLLSGSNVKFTSASQFLSRTDKNKHTDLISIGIAYERGNTLTTRYKWETGEGLRIEEMTLSDDTGTITLWEGMSESELLSQLDLEPQDMSDEAFKALGTFEALRPVRNRCFITLELAVKLREDDQEFRYSLPGFFVPPIRALIHVPPLRGMPERAYPVAAVGPDFPGTFEHYVATVIADWQRKKSDELQKLNRNLRFLGLTSSVKAHPIGETQVELRVGRLLSEKRNGPDLVNIADVGFGVSQTLPILVALLAAQPGQLVYLEQPEIHLHPRAQRAMAKILIDAAKRGVRVVAETHSALLLLGIQTLVAKGGISPDKVILHWFKRSPKGITTIKSADLGKDGSFGDWPEDFSEVELKAEMEYLGSVESHATGK